MPKADRILANLPPTFRLRGDPSALRALVDAYGGELQTAENSLVAVMRAHWASFADAGEPRVTDLALFAALYGLAPRPDESVEEFREHVFRFVRTQLGGTVTVRGILRVTAEALGLHIEDDALETWWHRPDPVLVTHLPRGADAATALLGVGAATVTGRDAAPAELRGLAPLAPATDLTGPHLLLVARDGGGVVTVDLRAGAVDPAAATPQEIAAAVDAELAAPGSARLEDGRLVLTSPTTGSGSAVVLEDGDDDAAELVLGRPPRTYAGTDATHARITGTADLSNPLDLRDARYLRLVVDGDHLAEVDVAAAAADPAAVDVADVTAAINGALGIDVAADDGRFLTLTSPTLGAAGSIVLLDPAAQSATRRLLGDPPPSAVGAGARPARLVSARRIGRGVDLSETSALRLALDDQPAVTVDVAGLDPAATLPAEIVAAVNEGLGAEAASHDGDRVTLVSPTTGAAGALVVAEVPGDAAPAVLGLAPRSAHGTDPVTAALTGTVSLTGTVPVYARHLLRLRVDGAEPITVDLRDGVADPGDARLDEIVDAVNAALGAEAGPVATDDGTHLILVSPREGAAGSLAVEPVVTTARRRFVTRARVTDDAATTVLGYTARRAAGTPATPARLAGTANLSGGVDLAVDRYVRVRVGGAEGVDVDAAGPRPRATTAAEAAARLALVPGLEARTDGRTIVLTDPTTGSASGVTLEPPRVLDALGPVLGRPPGLVRGEAAAGVRLTGTADLSAGVELAPDAALRLGVDGAPPVDVVVGDATGTAVRPLSQLVALVNLALGAPVAGHDGTHLLLTSPTTGAGSALTIEAPATGTDATATVLGFPAPRTYRGRAATAARVVGTVDLTGGADLRVPVLPPRPATDPAVAHLLRLAVDGGDPVTVDLLPEGGDPAAVDAATITAAIRAATTADATTVAVPGGVVVAISSPTTGLSSRLELSRAVAGDAAPRLLGTAGATAAGTDAAPARLSGDVDLLGTVDLAERSVLRLALDGGEPVDVDVAGVTPGATLAEEIVLAIEAVLPGVASVGPDSRLLLTSTDPGPGSAVEVLAVRHLEVVEYPPTTQTVTTAVAHGAAVHLTSAGAADVPARVEASTLHGVSGPTVSDPVAGWSVHVATTVGAGGRLVLEAADDGGVRARVLERGTWHDVPADHVDVTRGQVAPLTVRRGRSRWSWTECDAARFDDAVLGSDAFAGGPCVTEAVFDVSRFAATDPPSAFAAAGPRAPTATVAVTWDAHTAGAFEVHLPADLDPRFGRPFGEARFGSTEPERIPGVVMEPATDPDYVLDRVTAGSRLVKARIATRVPIGWSAAALPFRDPVPLTLGGPAPEQEARLFVSGPGLAPRFLEIRAADVGTYGNDITVAARAVGPEIYDLEVFLPGTRFENARAVVAGPAPPTLAAALLAPAAVGVGTAKAAGVRAVVTRDRVTEPATHPHGPGPQEEGPS